MKILFAWTGVTSYMASCWRALQALEGVSFSAVVENVESGSAFDVNKLFSSLDVTVVEKGALAPEMGKPDILFAVGWRSPMVRALVEREDWADVPKVCCFDMPFRKSLRCFVARFALQKYLRLFDAAYVPGVVAERYAKWLGFKKIERGLFSIDIGKFSAGRENKERKGFLYAGRFSPEKRVGDIKKAYEIYRSNGGKWEIVFCGQGGRLVSPDEMPSLYSQSGCLILASSFDPWPLVALESSAAGCSVIMSDKCGNRFELSSSRVFKCGDVRALAKLMLEAENAPRFEENNIGQYDCAEWASRTLRIANELVFHADGSGR